ncbi:codeine O-demethylase-like [Abrus precatorius]|uniref:Codeine O-demethylase-like n=1 Tax=Abrus precatorius TaxID=3816 RepID=A0A8B8K374_ABRPR|nr:codeine O-demethylase-like [Abrus precatorius]
MVSSQVVRSESSEEAMLSVQELIKNPLTSLPHCYIQLDNHEPSSPFQDHAIPTINLKNLIQGEATEQELQKLNSACRDWGFFQLVDHGISPLMLETLKEETEGFFKLPLEEKIKYKIRPGDVEGYGISLSKSKDQKLDWGDRLFMTTNPHSIRKPHLFPKLPSSLRTILESYILEMQNLAKILVGMLGNMLKINERELEGFEDGIQNLRMNYYPPCLQPELVVGLTAHSDASGITILNQVNGVNGLQIKKDGIWIPVNVSSDAFIVNIGDILEIMSNGLYKSVEHRVTVNSEKERISIAMFFNPKFQSEIEPSVNLTNQENPPLYKRIKMEKYLKDFMNRRKLDGKSYLEHMKITN